MSPAQTAKYMLQFKVNYIFCTRHESGPLKANHSFQVKLLSELCLVVIWPTGDIAAYLCTISISSFCKHAKQVTETVFVLACALHPNASGHLVQTLVLTCVDILGLFCCQFLSLIEFLILIVLLYRSLNLGRRSIVPAFQIWKHPQLFVQ